MDVFCDIKWSLSHDFNLILQPVPALPRTWYYEELSWSPLTCQNSFCVFCLVELGLTYRSGTFLRCANKWYISTLKWALTNLIHSIVGAAVLTYICLGWGSEDGIFRFVIAHSGKRGVSAWWASAQVWCLVKLYESVHASHKYALQFYNHSCFSLFCVIDLAKDHNSFHRNARLLCINFHFYADCLNFAAENCESLKWCKGLIMIWLVMTRLVLPQLFDQFQLFMLFERPKKGVCLFNTYIGSGAIVLCPNWPARPFTKQQCMIDFQTCSEKNKDVWHLPDFENHTLWPHLH